METHRELRIRNGFTQDQLAKELNVTRQTISSWERGKSLPDIEMISSIASMYDISINALFLNEIILVNKSLKKSNLIIWFISIILVSTLSIYIYKDMYYKY
ncbi:helix-turn-helix domain-containing protein [Mycoplasmatota bacterium WC44]